MGIGTDHRTDRQAVRDSLNSRLWAFQSLMNDEINQAQLAVSADSVRKNANAFRIAAGAAEQLLADIVLHLEGKLP